MARAWIGLILLSLLALQVDGGYGKKPLPYPWNIYFWLIFVAVFFIIPCFIACCCASQSIANDRNREENRVALTRNPSFERHQWQVHLSKVNETKPSTMEKRGGQEEEHLLPQQRVTVQLVDEQLVDLEVPPAELTLTTFSKLLSDLTYYSGVPDIQGLLVKSESGGFVQVFDMGRIPKENFKARAVMSGTKHFLRLYPNSKLEE